MTTFMFALNAVLYTDNDIRVRAKLALIKEENEMLHDMPKSFYSYLITLVLTYLMAFILWIPKPIEEFLQKTIKTKNMLIIPSL